MNAIINTLDVRNFPVSRATGSSNLVGAEPALGLPTPKVADNEASRLELVEAAARKVADSFVLGDERFTIYKDVTGQYVTRFTSLRDGKVTYIPEPNLLRTIAPGNEIDIRT